MLTRLGAALIGLGVVIPTIIWGGVLGVQIVVAIVLLIALLEYAQMTLPGQRGSLVVLLVAAGVVFGHLQWGGPGQLASALAGATTLILVWSLLGVRETDQAARTASYLLAGVLYLPVMLSFVPWLRAFDSGGSGGIAWLFLVLMITWLGDTGAYFAGRAFGRRKLMPRISPKKTWEGAIGGALLAIVGVALMKFIALPDLPWLHVVMMGLVIDAVGVLGDLVESMFKRAMGVKDSGSIMPGHGGILDRIDSLLLTAPALWSYARLFELA